MDDGHFHLFELSEKNQKTIYCFLDELFRNSLFENAFKITGSKHNLAGLLGVSEDIVYGWTGGKYVRGKKRIIPIPVYHLRRLVELVAFKDFDVVEYKVVKLKCKSSKSRIVGNPFPIALDHSFGRVVGSSFADGHITQHGTFVYANKDQSLICCMSNLIKKIFKVDCKVIAGKKSMKYLIIPSVIGKIAEEFGSPIGNKVTAERHEEIILDRIYGAPMNFKVGFISAVIDDEGCIRKDGRIKLKMRLRSIVGLCGHVLRGMHVKVSKMLIENYKFFYIYFAPDYRIKLEQKSKSIKFQIALERKRMWHTIDYMNKLRGLQPATINSIAADMGVQNQTAKYHIDKLIKLDAVSVVDDKFLLKEVKR